MSNSPEMIIGMLQHLDIEKVRKAFNAIPIISYEKDHIDNHQTVEGFIDNVELIQKKTIKQIPALLRKDG